jgi:hypothetical protein
MKSSPRQHAAARQTAVAVMGALEEIAETRGGRLLPIDVVDSARDEASPLHICFEWDDAICGERYRLDQARSLIANVRVRLTGEDGPLVRMFIHVPLPNAEHYAHAQVAMSDPATRALVLNRALSELRSMEARYRDLIELADVWRAAALIAA